MNADSRCTIDTNILIYGVDRDADEKHVLARELIGGVAKHGGILTVQALGEFFHATTRKNLLNTEIASQFIDDWRAVFSIVAANEAALERAIIASQASQYSFWDAMICATADIANCNVILSEDMQHGASFGGVTIVNPFAIDAKSWIDRILSDPR